MNVLFTLAVLAVLGLWCLAVHTRLHRLRHQILSEWKQLDAKENAGVAGVDGTRYNQLAAAYNAALERFPDSLVAGLARFRPAQMFVSSRP